MPEIINFINNDKDDLKNNSHREFLFVDNIFNCKKIKSGIKLCIIQTDFTKSELKIIKKLKITNKNTEFWISSKQLSRENILIANKIGIKTVINSPFSPKMVIEFFNNQDNNSYTDKPLSISYSCPSISNSKIMVVDDNFMNVELLREILSELNVEVSSFLKPKDAYKSILEDKFDLFLLDIMMPEMSGFELAKKIKATALNKDAPIVFISALSDSYNKIQGYDLGSFAYIEKPFDINIVKSQIFNILKNKKAQELISSNKESFLATVAHDLKTPIRAGINALNLLLEENLGELEDPQQEIVEDILNSTRFMQDMVDNILCKNKIENDKITLRKTSHSVKELVEHCIELTKHIVAPKQQQIELTSDVENTFLLMDFLEMKRAMHNLIANASEYSPIGGKILIKIFNNEDKMGFFVQDFGHGIDLENQEDVFSQYMSFAKKYKRVGSGLGLYITKKIVEEHGGEIFLNSQVGFGTKITVLLPIA